MATHPIDGGPVDSLGAFEDGLAVRLISTPRDRIKTCHVNEDLGAVVARNRVDEFDFLPVTDEPSTHSPPASLVWLNSRASAQE